MKLFVLALALVIASAVAQNCMDDGVTSQSACEAQCSSCQCFFEDGQGCGCYDGAIEPSNIRYACAFGSITPGDAIDQIKQDLVEALGEDCSSAINKVVNKKTVECFSTTDLEAADLTNATDIATACENECVGRMIGAVQILSDAGCLRSVDDNTPGQIADLLEPLNLVEDLSTYLASTCAKAMNGEFCANVIPFLYEYSTSSSTFDAADCQSLLDYGNCIGNIRAAFDANPNIFQGNPVNATAVVASLDAHCDMEGVSGIKTASESTEAPANLGSSSASAVSGVVALVATAVAAAIVA